MFRRLHIGVFANNYVVYISTKKNNIPTKLLYIIVRAKLKAFLQGLELDYKPGNRDELTSNDNDIGSKITVH